DRIVAIKVLRPHLTESAEQVARFRREAQAVSALNHRNIAAVHLFDEANGLNFLVLEYLPNGTLYEKLRADALLPIEQVLIYGIQIAEGLAHAHKRGIVHRDVKTSNAMLTEEGQVKITDFGLAKQIGDVRDSSGVNTESGRVMGTAAYMAPEQASGRETDERSDVFSLGVVLHELVTGSRPFQASNDLKLLQEIIHRPAPRLAEFRTDVPPELEQIVQRTLEKDPARRFQRMEDLLSELRILRTRMLTPETKDDIPTDTERFRRIRRRRWAVAVVTMIAVVAALLMWRTGRALPTERHLALLPFVNINGDAASQAFCDGLIETLTSNLTQLEQFQGSLRVVPSSEVRRAGISSAGEASRLFGVNLAITGSVQKAGERWRISGNLVDARSQRQLRGFSEVFDPSDATGMQEGVMQRFVGLLELELQPKARGLLASGATPQPGAYEYYVQGRGYLWRYDRGENIDMAIGLLQRALERDSSYALAHAGLGEAYWRKYGATHENQWADLAKRHADRASQINAQSAPVHVTVGIVNRGTGRYKEAAASFERALRIDPLSADALRGLGSAQEALQRLPEAEATYKKAIDLRPSDWAGHLELASFYSRRGRYGEAQALAERATQLTPDNPAAYRDLGGYLMFQGRYADAAPVLERSIAIKPTDGSYSNLGTSYYWMNRYADAARMYEKAIELGQSQSAIWANLGDAYKLAPGLAGKAPDAYRRAIHLAEQQRAVNPREPQVLARLAVLYAKTGNPQKAIREIEAARRLAPSNATILFRSAIAYELAGRRAQALKDLATARKAGYSFHEISNAPHLAELRKDPRYGPIGQGGPPN
ncbi:MAG: protein kinase domain-containing protein, partial [Bryobacteraceae bacterium]